MASKRKSSERLQAVEQVAPARVSTGGRTSLDVDALRQIVEMLEGSDISRLTWTNGTERLSIRRGQPTYLTAPMPQQLQSVYAEVRVPRYRRSFTLSRELDASRIEANLKDGVLNLRIPKQ